MAIYPVILCGGAGTRLWPASRDHRPKQFLSLAGDLSLFQETIARVAPLTGAHGRIVVVAGRDHASSIADQLDDADAVLLIEPVGRDSAPAVTAAAEWIARQDPDAVALFVASDHHIPDAAGFRAAVLEGAKAAEEGRIVTFGVRPSEPSSAYGYIQPDGPGLAPVKRFVEKPDRRRAETYVKEGYLWNSGNFVVRADVLLTELEAHAPEVLRTVRQAFPAGDGGSTALDETFSEAPRISIDYAVMEKSDRVSVLPVGFGWSDLGAWDAVAATGEADRGLWIGGGGDGANLVRAAEGMVIATAGVSDLAIIAEPDAVLVCHLSRSQEVKGLVERLRKISPRHVHGAASEEDVLEIRARAFDDWVRFNALPLWATTGVAGDGGFYEAIDRTGAPVGDFRRARVQARQAYVYSAAGQAGWAGPWRRLVTEGLERFETTNRRPDGLYRTRVSVRGEVLNDTASLYDQAFVLLAMAAAASAGIEPGLMGSRAQALREALEGLAHPGGGWREDASHPHQANAHMHLLEACLAWEAIEPGGAWAGMADTIVGLAERAFIDPDGGFLREFFDADWRPAAGEAGRLVEPGHQFEWAWLLTRWGRARSDDWSAGAARRLYDAGLRGINSARGVAVDEMDDGLAVRSGRARLWPQTERLKAALILAEDLPGGHAGHALKGLQAYLEPTGLWRDKQEPDGSFVIEPAPASSLYHIAAAWLQLRETLKL
ncbi:mannose-1-phosphate guanylyltransferase/mannose-6-phosphate isomerase [Brevundimonas basaltis]|uniref:Mannose-1-phosphate guanylyltransferase/mannose-6-phosphate isomerase n=1 Tax=Brevundimonas basaltis TaxID=472166 RepID=A0A7W8MI62_9CAUL|nr:AGE family epimerase/isomerase [Brevundimonas basaltis]MBB5292666.1 mannose-1-phosphate guanylyltransferase/mannose-6-phosphate isomerase [Brevundimonas basaltis]